MAETFAETLDRVNRQRQPVPQTFGRPVAAPLPTDYGQRPIPGGTMVDADTYTQGAETFRVAGLDAPELKDKRTGALIPEGQQAYQNSAQAFQTPVQSERIGVDKHGRTVARPIADGRDLGAEMVRRGDARTVDWNHSGMLPYAREAAARFDEVNPPSEAAKAMAEYQGGALDGRIRIAPPKDPKTRGYLEEGEAGIKRGIDQAQSGLYGALSLAGRLIADDSRGSDPRSWRPDDPRLTLRDKISNWLQRTGDAGVMRNDEQAAQNPAAYSFKDVREGKADLLQWVIGVLGEAAPSTAVMAATAAATGGVGALVGRAAAKGALGAGVAGALEASALKAAEGAATTAIRRSLLERGVAPVLAQATARKIAADPVSYATKAYAARGAFLGAWTGSSALEGGHMWTEAQRALGPQADPKYALAGGLAAGLLDTGAMMVMAAPFLKAFSTPAASAALEQVAGATLGEKLAALTGAVVKGSLRGIVAESPTEGIQELFAIASVEAQKDSPIPLVERLQAPEYIDRILEASAAGFVFGGAFRGAGGGVQHATRRTARPVEETAPATDTTAPGADTTAPGADTATPGAPPATLGADTATPGAPPATLGADTTAPGAPQAQPVDPITQIPSVKAKQILYMLGHSTRDDADIARVTGVDPALIARIRAAQEVSSAPTTAAPTSTEPTTAAPTSTEPTTAAPTSTEPTTTAAKPPAAPIGTVLNERRAPEPYQPQLPPTPSASKSQIRRLSRGESVVLRPGATEAEAKPAQPATEPTTAAPTSTGPTTAAQPEARPDLPNTRNPYLAKDRGKWAGATKFIGRGQPRSSTQRYAEALGEKYANTGAYTAEDRVFVSAEGKRDGRVEPDYAEIQKALDAGATVITDPPNHRNRPFNVGEREVEAYLKAHGYAEEGETGTWRPVIRQEEAPPDVGEAPPAVKAPTNPSFTIVRAGFNRQAKAREGVIWGMRGPKGETILTAEPGAPGWLGNPFVAGDVRPGGPPRGVATEQFREVFLERIKDPAFRAEVEKLRGKEVGYYKPDEKYIHLHVVQQWLAENPPTQQEEAPPSSPPTTEPTTATPGTPPVDPITHAEIAPQASIQLKRGESIILHNERGAPEPYQQRNPPAPSGPKSQLRLQRPEAQNNEPAGQRDPGQLAPSATQTEAQPPVALPPGPEGADGARAGETGAGPGAAGAVAPAPKVPKAETKPVSAPATRTPMSAEAMKDPAVRSGLLFAKRLKKMWADLLGTDAAPIEVSVEQVKALAGTDPEARYGAALTLARDYAKTFVADQWAKAGEQVRKSVWEAYKKSVRQSGQSVREARKGPGARAEFDAWLAREVGDVLLDDARMQKLYADADLGLAYRWIRKIGVALAKLARDFFGTLTGRQQESDPAVAEFVRNMVDHRRTELAERQGLSPETTRRFKEATHRLIGGEGALAQIDELEQRLAEDRAGPLYKRWLAALKRAQKAVDAAKDTDPKVLDRVQLALRDAIEKADPLWRKPGPWRRRVLRQRASAELRTAELRAIAPKAASAVEEIARLAAEIEDALAIARSFEAAGEVLTPAGKEAVRREGRPMADLLGATEHDRVAGRAVARAFLSALRRPAEVDALTEFEALFKKRAKDDQIVPFRAALAADRAGLSAALAANDQKLAGSKVRAKIGALWRGLGFAVEDAPQPVPAGELWGRVGVQVAPGRDALEQVADAVGEYAAATRLMEMLPGAYRDALAAAYEREGVGEPMAWFGEQFAAALRSDPVIWQSLYRIAPEATGDAAQHIADERAAYRSMLETALRAKEFAVPEVVEALRYRLRARYGREAIDRAERALGKADSPLGAWYLMSLGYGATEGGAPAFDAERAKAVKTLLKQARSLYELVPGADEMTPGEAGQMLDRNISELSTLRPTFESLAPGQNMARSLVEWLASLNAPTEAADAALSPGETVEEDPNAALDEAEDDDSWISQALEEGSSKADEVEFRQEIEDAAERKTLIENTLALMSDYSPSVPRVNKAGERHMTKPGLYRRFKVLVGEAGAQLLNSDQATTFQSELADNEKFEADIGDANFRLLPVDVQHVLLQRAQMLSRLGASAEYRLARHRTTAGREVRHIVERVVLSDRATIHTARMKDGSSVTEQLQIDRVRAELEDANRRTSRWSSAAKYGSEKDRRFGAIDFEVRAALDHPLLSRLVEAMDRDPLLGDELREAAANYALIPEAELLQRAQALLPTLRRSIEADPALQSMLTKDADGFAQLIVAAMGYDQEMMFNDWSDTLKDESLRPYERPTQTKSKVFVHEEAAKLIGLTPERNEKGKIFYRMTVKGNGAANNALTAFLRLFVAGYDPRTNTIKTGVRATLSGDALVGVGGKTLTGLEGSPNTNFDRVHRLYRGFDLATQLPNPWLPVDPFWSQWHGLNSEALQTDPHMDLIVFKGAEETITLGQELAERKVADIVQGDGTEHVVTREKSMAEIDEDTQFWKARIEALFRQVDESMGAPGTEQLGVYGVQATTDHGTPIWTLNGVMPAEVAEKYPTIRIGERTAVTWRFAANQQLTVKTDDASYTARPYSVLEELEYAQSRITSLRKRLRDLREKLVSAGLINEQRMMAGSDLNYYQNVEEELVEMEARIERLGLGDYRQRVNQEQVLFNPDLNSSEKQWNADLKGHRYEGLHDLVAPGEQKGKGDAVPETRDLPLPAPKPAPAEERDLDPAIAGQLNLPPPNVEVRLDVESIPLPPVGDSMAGTLVRFAADAARRLGLNARDIELTVLNTDALRATATRDRKALGGAFDDAMRALGYADLAESVWRHAIEEPVFAVFDGGKAHIVAFDSDLRSGEKLSADYLRGAVAHEMGHIYFREYLAPKLRSGAQRASLVKQLEAWDASWQDKLGSDLRIEEAVAEVIRAKLTGQARPEQKAGGNTGLGRIVTAVKKAWTALFGAPQKGEDDPVAGMAEHNRMRASQRVVRHFSGRRLLESSTQLGKNVWEVFGDGYDAIVRTTHSWLRGQRGRDGAPLASFQLLADILRWTPGRAPESRSLGGQTFDFTAANSDYRQSFEQVTTREFARRGHQVEAMLAGWDPEREKTRFWQTKRRAEIEEARRVRQVEAVRDFVAGRDTRGARDLRQFFDGLGGYFGPVLKRYDPEKVLPRIFDQEALRARKDEFLALLTDRGATPEDAAQVFAQITHESGSDYRNDAGQFFAPHFQRARMGDALDAISDADLLPFLLIDSQPQAALWQYVHQAVKRTEFERRFGGWVYFDGTVDFSVTDNNRPRLLSAADAARMEGVVPTRDQNNRVVYHLTLPDGSTKRVLWDQTAKFRLLRAVAVEDGASQSQLNYLLKAIEAELGRYGANFSPRIRAAQSALIAGMNWAVLPLSITSQFTDLALPLLRSNGDFKAAWKGMKTAIAEMRKAGDLTLAARANGILAGDLRNYFASAYLDTPFISAGAQRWNNRLFRYNGMEKATEFVRLFAFATGKEWIKSLAAKGTAEGDAQLKQLGLTRRDVLAWAADQEKLDTGAGAPDEVSERVQQALNTFVEQSMFRPSASQRPAWASHPAAMLVWYLKSYVWAYADTILSRTGREFMRLDSYGQKALMLALPALFMMPLAAFGLMLRDELRDELTEVLPWRRPKRQREEDATDYAMRLVGRTGLLGPMQTLVDAGRAQEYGSPYYLSLIGPFATMSDQIIRRGAASGEGQVTRGAVDALSRVLPVLGALPGERQALVNWMF